MKNFHILQKTFFSDSIDVSKDDQLENIDSFNEYIRKICDKCIVGFNINQIDSESPVVIIKIELSDLLKYW